MTHGTDVDMPFKDEFREALASGRKVLTSRTRKIGYPGATFEAFGVTYAVLHVVKRPLAFIADYCWRQEGCKSPDDFKETWVRIHRRVGWRPAQWVWVHCFERIS